MTGEGGGGRGGRVRRRGRGKGEGGWERVQGVWGRGRRIRGGGGR